MQMLQTGNIAAARKIASELLRDNPYDDASWVLQYQCSVQERGRASAHDVAKAWISNLPNSPSAHFSLLQLAIRFLGFRNQAKSEAPVEAYRQQFPEEIENYQYLKYLVARAYEDRTVVMAYAAGLIKDHPTNIDTVLFHGWLLCNYNQFKRAHESARAAISLAPDNAEAFRLLAISSFREMRIKEARLAAESTLRIDPFAYGMKLTKALSSFVLFPPFFIASLFVKFVLQLENVMLPSRGFARVLSMIASRSLLLGLAMAAGILMAVFDMPGIAQIVIASFFVLGVAWVSLTKLIVPESDLDLLKTPPKVKLRKY